MSVQTWQEGREVWISMANTYIASGAYYLCPTINKSSPACAMGTSPPLPNQSSFAFTWFWRRIQFPRIMWISWRGFSGGGRQWRLTARSLAQLWGSSLHRSWIPPWNRTCLNSLELWWRNFIMWGSTLKICLYWDWYTPPSPRSP